MASFTIGGVKPKNININGDKCKKVIVNGVTVWSAEEAKSNLSAEVINYREYQTTHSAESAGSWDLRGWSNISFSWNISVNMSWPNPYGVTSTTRVYLRFADGTTTKIAERSGKLWTADSTYTGSGSSTVNLANYTDNQLATVKLYITLGDMSAETPHANADRHNASVSITSAVAS